MAIFFITLAIFFYSGISLCSSDCGQFFDNNVSQDDANTIVNAHNYYRGLISQGSVQGQPRGTNLKTMKWDAKLAEEAKKIAATCEFKHVAVQDSRFYVGQNLYWTGSTNGDKGAKWNDCVTVWFNENVNYHYPDNPNEKTGHYTQVVWANTEFVGCGFAWYRKDNWYQKLYVCNYGPGGNIIGQAPYKI